MATKNNKQLLALLKNDFQPLYAVLDAARDPLVLARLLYSQAQYQSLYKGPAGDSLAQVAPYLVRLTADSPFLETLVAEGWGKSWGVYLTCNSEFAELRRHLRHFLEVWHPDGKQVYFRFYDPRVLRVYLPSCAPEEIKQFLGPIGAYLMEDEGSDRLIHFRSGEAGLEKTVITFSPEDVSSSAAATVSAS